MPTPSPGPQPPHPGSAVSQPLILGSLEHLQEHSPAHPTGQLSIPSTSPLSTQQPSCLHLASKPPHFSPEAKIALVSCSPSGRTVLTVYSTLSLFLPSYISSLSGQGLDLICLWLPSSWASLMAQAVKNSPAM